MFSHNREFYYFFNGKNYDEYERILNILYREFYDVNVEILNNDSDEFSRL